MIGKMVLRMGPADAIGAEIWKTTMRCGFKSRIIRLITGLQGPPLYITEERRSWRVAADCKSVTPG